MLAIIAALVLLVGVPQVQAAGWTASTPGSDQLNGVCFADTSTGWMGGTDGAWKSTDGGATWTKSFYDPVFAIECASSTVGWMSAGQSSGTGLYIYRTTNGSSWSPVYGIVGTVYGMDSVSSVQAWGVGYFGYVVATTDGSTWNSQVSGTSSTLYGVSAASSTVVWAVGLNGTIRKTADGGSSWSGQSSGTSNTLYGVSAPSTSVAYAAGTGGTILKTTDGGTNWNAQTSGTAVDLYDIHFVSTTVGYAVGAGGTILYTGNGGATWTAQTSNTTNTLRSVHFANSMAGWAVGDSGRLVRTTDGGGLTPTIATLTSSTHPSQASWYTNNDPAFAWTSSDPGGTDGYSYVLDQTAGTTPDTTSEGTGTSISYADKADGTWYFHVRARNGNGWGAASHYTVKIDASGPTAISGLASSTHPSQSTWYTNNTPAFSWSASTDTYSGMAGYSYVLDQTAGTTPDTTVDGSGLSKTYTAQSDGIWYFHIRAVDNLGNGGATSHYTVKMDKTVPGVINSLASSTHPSQTTWYLNNTPAFSWTASSDTTSGIAGYSYVLDQASGTTPDAAVDGTGLSKTYTAQSDGTFYFHIRSVDNAGNAGTTSHYTVKIDATVPGAIGSLTSSTHPSQTTWYTNNDPAFSWTASSDAGSGIAGYSWGISQDAMTLPDLSVEGTGLSTAFTDRGDGTWYFKVRAIDNAGNGGPVSSYTVKIDTAVPGAINNLASSTHPSQTTWYANNTPAFSWTASSDAGSGIAGYSYAIDASTGTVPDVTVDGMDPSKTFAAQGDGTRYFHVRSVDNAGNGGATSHYTVKIDTTGPTAISSLASPSHPVQTNWYSSTASIFTWEMSDDGGAGVAGYSYVLDGISGTTPDTTVEDVDTGVLFPGQSDGTKYFHVRAVDSLGNGGTTSHYTVKTDLTDPTTTATGLQASTGTGWTTSPQLVTLSGSDALSGLAATSYRIDGGALQTYTGAFSVSGIGSHTVRYYSTDNAGNVEATHLGYVNIKGDAGAAWPPWKWQNPLPTGDDFYGLDFASSDTGWAVGDTGQIFKTVDGGATWTPRNAQTRAILKDVDFVDAQSGWAVGDGGTVLATGDGGATWNAQDAGTTTDLYSVSFADSSHGWASGSGGLILATANGGQTWSAQTSGTTTRLPGVKAVDAQHAWVIGWSGTVLATSDGGQTWNAQTPGTTVNLTAVEFLDATTGWIVGPDGTILKTSDGGVTWDAQTSNTTNTLYGVSFADSQYGWAVGSAGTVVRTTNGGSTWTPTGSGQTENLRDVCGSTGTIAVTVGGRGTILTTANGMTWTARKSTVTSAAFQDMDFVDTSSGWAVGTSGTIVGTVDGGDTWSVETSGTTNDLYDAHFVSTTTGWAVGQGGTILKTTNGGTSWSAQTSGTSNILYGVWFSDAQTGWAVGVGGVMLSTTNGGSSWTAQTSGTGNNLWAIEFTDADTGWTVGQAGTILKTTDGGASWNAQASGTGNALWDMDFVSSTTGWAVGYGGTIVATTNGGATWSTQGVGLATNLRSVQFLDADTGWTVGASGTILKTADGGDTWAAQASGTAHTLYGVSFVDERRGWVAGDYGSILATEVSGSLDTTAPSAITGLASSTHPVQTDWYTSTTPAFSWDAATDDDSGIDGYSYVLNETVGTVPDRTVEGTGPSTSYDTQSDGVHYFHVRAVDNMGNAGPASHYTVGIDTVAPATTDDAPSVRTSAPVIVHFEATDATSGVAHTYYTVDGGLTQEGASVEFTGVGVYAVTYWSVDAAGNVESAHSISVDVGAAGSMLINNGASSTATAEVLLNSSVSGSGEMRFRNAGGTWGDWETYAPIKVWTLASGTGEKTVEAQYGDGGSVALEVSDSILLDASYPGGMMQINNGASSTADLAVTLTNDVAGATEMRFRDAGGTWSGWETFAATKSWTLPGGGEATKTVDAEFRNADLKVLQTSDDILYDTAAPSGMMLIDGGAAYTAQASVTLGNSVTGATQMRFRNAGGAWSDWEAFAATKPWTLAGGDGLKVVEGQFRDAELDVLDCPDAIVLDTTGPGAVGGLASSTHPVEANWYTNNAPSFNWNAASDAGSGIDGYSYVLDQSAGTTPDATVDGSTLTKDYPAQADGVFYFHIRAVDTLGNAGVASHYTVRIDTTDPATTATGLQASKTVGWTVGPQLVTLDATDAGSGVAATSYRIDGGALQTYAGAFSIAALGSHSVRYYSTDVVGNVETVHTGYVNIKGDVTGTLPPWKWQNPLPQGNALWSIDSVSAQTAWAVGTSGTILKTGDGGATWVTQNSASPEYLTGVDFVDAQNGWVVGWNGTILATTDGGATWNEQGSGTTQNLRGVFFSDAQHGWAVGVAGTIVATSDGGATWAAQASGTTQGLRSVSFIDAQAGWAVGANGTIVATVDGGASWDVQISGTAQTLYGVSFVDAQHGWAVGAGGTVLATSNGGATWAPRTSGTTQTLNGVSFVDADTGWATGDGGVIVATTDGGATWHAQASGTTMQFGGVHFVDDQNGWVVGEAGVILTTADGGATWTAESSDVTRDGVNGVDFIDPFTGWAVGDAGTILATTDGGTTWIAQTSGVTQNLRDVTFVDAQTGWAVGVGGTALATTDGGATWTAQDSDTLQTLNEVEFIDELNGWAVGNGGAVQTTVDGGSTWVTRDSGVTVDLFGVSFVGEQTGWAVGENGTILKSVDGGASWSPQASGTTAELRDVCFVDSSTGWAVGLGGVIVATTDGGATWNTQTSATTQALYGVRFVDTQNGWAAGYTGAILKTTDGGATWTAQSSGTTNNYYGIEFVDEKIGWVVGASGTIMATTVGGGLDTTGPSAVENLTSATHPVQTVWYSVNAPEFSWDAATDEDSGIDGYSFTLDENAGTVPDRTVDGSGLSASYATQTDGVHYFHIRAVDNLGNAGATAHYAVRIDTVTPATTDDAPSGAQSGPVTVRFSGTDAHSGVTHTYYTVDGGLAQEGTSVTVSRAGVTQLTYWSVDAAGNTESARSVTVEISLSGSMAINNGANVTVTTRVLLFSSVADATRMRFRNAGGTWGAWQAYAPVKSWVLSAGGGTTKTVEAQYGDDGTGFLETSDTILLDATYPGGMMLINNGASSTADLAVTLHNAVTGANQMRFRDAGGTWTEWDTFAATKAWTLPAEGDATKTVEAQFRNASLLVLEVNDSILLDPEAPSGSMTINDGEAYTRAAAITLNMDITGATEMRFRDEDGAWTEWESYAGTKAWTLPDGEGLKVVEGQFRDAELKALDCPASITLDSVDPSAITGLSSGTHPVETTWYANDDPAFGWDAATDDGSGIAGYSFVLDDTADTVPDVTVDGGDVSKVYSDRPDGLYYFHIRAVDNAGAGGPASHLAVRIDTTPPVTTDDAPGAPQSGPVTVHFDATDATSGVAHTYYTVNGGSAVEGTSVEVSADGTTQLTYWSVDVAGNTESAHSASVVIGSGTTLTGTMVINNGASSTVTTRVLLHSAVDGATQMRFRDAGGTWSEWEAYGPVKVWTLPSSGDAAKTVEAQYRDEGAGFLETSDTILLDATYPGGMMQINGGASSTADLAVTLTNAVTGATEMRFRDAGGAWSEWETFAATKAWTLPSGGEATKTVEAEFRNASLLVLEVSDAILFDGEPPTGMMTIDGGAYTKTAAVTLTNAVTGATEMRFRDAGGAWSEWEAFAGTKAWTIAGSDGLKVVESQFRNAALQVLDCPASVVLDSHGPNAPGGVTATWVRLAGNNGRVSCTYVATEAEQLSPLVVTATVKTSGGMTRATATYTGESLDQVLSHTMSATLVKGSYRLVISMADAAGNAAPSASTVVFPVN